MTYRLLLGLPLSVLLAFGSVSVAQDDVADEEVRWTVLHVGTLLASPGDAVATDRTVVIRNRVISALHEGLLDVATAVPEAAPETVRLFDLTQHFVLPGLIDSHVHLSFESGVDGQPNYGGADAFLELHRSAKDDAYRFVDAIVNARKTLEAGFTTVRNVGSNGWHIFALRDAIRDGHLTGPRILASGHTIRIGADDGSGACTDVPSCRRATREQIDMGADLIKVYATCSGGKPCGHREAPAVFLEDEIRAVVETAASRELKVAAHAHGTAGVNLAAESGVASIEHGSFNDEAARRTMRRGGVFLVPTLAVQDNIRRDIADATGAMRAVMQGFLDNHGPRMLAAHRAGVRIAAGSDAGVTAHGNNARELELYVENGLTPEEAIVAATVHAAELLGESDEIGRITVGRTADLIAVTGNPLEDISRLRAVEFVVKDGRVEFDDR